VAGGRRLGRCLGGTAVVLVVVFGLAGPATAHAQLEWTQPVTSAVLSSPPRQVLLHFGEPVEIDFGSVRVLGPSGNRVDLGGTHHPPGDDHSVAVSLPAGLARGTYVVAWRVISADSHPVHGAFVFSVGSAVGVPQAASLASALGRQSGSTAVGAVFGLVRFASFAGLVLLVGVGAVVMIVRPGRLLTRRIGALLWASWAVLVLTSVVGVAVQGVYAAGLPVGDIVRPSLFDEVLHTRFGEVELLRVALCLAAVPVLVVLRRAGRTDLPAGPPPAVMRWAALGGAVVGLGLVATPGLAGHAASNGGVALGLVLDVAHVAAAALWLGGLAVLAALLLPGGRTGHLSVDLGSVAARISACAFGAVVVIVASGGVQSLRAVGSWYALFHTTYGVTLLVKIGIAAVLVAVGGLSRRFLRRAIRGAASPGAAPGVASPGTAPGVGSDGVPTTGSPPASSTPVDPFTPGSGAVLTRPSRAGVAVHPSPEPAGLEPAAVRKLRRSVLAETGLAVAVLAVTALLVNAVPAKQAAAQPFTSTFDVLGIQVNAVIGPARVGPDNQFHFYVLGGQGQPEGIPELDATMSLPGQGIGPIVIPLRVGGPGHYLATRVAVPFAGVWDLKLTVRTSSIDEQEVFAHVPVR